jgi:uncharacterized protein YjbJ (UPF0337 family)
MGATVDKAKGRAKEATGAIADNDELRREGKLDQAAGKVKAAAEKLVDNVRDTVTVSPTRSVFMNGYPLPLVTLRDPVKSAEEQAAIVALAQEAGGVKRVDNQITTMTASVLLDPRISE